MNDYINCFSDENYKQKERSGDVNFEDKLVSFLYELMRDHIPPGKIEDLVRNSSSKKTFYTNGYLALYAKDIADRLRK